MVGQDRHSCSETCWPIAVASVVSGLSKLVPNRDEQAALKRMKAMHRAGKTYREIGGQFGKDPKTVQRILTRGSAKA